MTSGGSGVGFEPERAKRTDAKGYAIRFAFGGVVTAVAGFIAKQYGPVVGGLFLGFPAILPASLTLFQKHEGKSAAADDALGATLGSIGLAAFALVVWAAGTRLAPWLALTLATAAWLAVSVAAWQIYTWVQGSGRG